ncbi:MAG: STAS domain-containing protein [Solirubrobacteraceae bacterium]
MLRLKCLSCGLDVPYKGSAGDLCPRCLVREDQAVELMTISDQPSVAGRRTIGHLRIHSAVSDLRHVLTLSGELDIGSAQVLEEAVDEVCASGAEQLVLDLCGIDFMDSMGLRALLHAREQCHASGCSFHMAPASRPVQHVLDATGLRRRLALREASA